MSTETKPSNPKDAIGSKKLMVHLVPSTAIAYMALAFTEGAVKYGKYNWRVAGVRFSIYLDAMYRHIMKLQNGENKDAVTGVPHLASIMACAAIITDAFHYNKLTDDRPYVGEDEAGNAAGFAQLLDVEMANISAKVKEVFKDFSPEQFTIGWQDHANDTQAPAPVPTKKGNRNPKGNSRKPRR